MTGKCKLCERGRVRHAHRQALLISKWESRAPGVCRETPTHPAKALCCLHVLKARLYFGFWNEKLHRKRCLIFINYLKRSLSLILGKIFCLSVFPLWQIQSRGAGWKGFCPGQMVEHKNPADSRNNLKKREEISLNQYGEAKINGYSGSLEKTLLHYFTKRSLMQGTRQRTRRCWVQIQRDWAAASSLWSQWLSHHVAGAGEEVEVALDRSHPSQHVDRSGFWQSKDDSCR